MSQKDLANRAGLSRTLIGMTEMGYVPGDDSVRRIARALGCKPEELRSR